ncbi:DUF3969 family protein [Clostridium sp.]|uniref:DUF3969 family protein n=1 Tax=Clostridium sp. TaxID=1506 RepID=UPI00292CF15E|nr:DUF3969 family protein [Clostridium sp.]
MNNYREFNMLELKISLRNKNEIERFLLINIIGIMDSLKEELITIDECEIYLFSPYSINKLCELKINNEIISLLEEGTELEDVESLVPEKLKSTIDNLKFRAIDLLSKISNEEICEYKKWID